MLVADVDVAAAVVEVDVEDGVVVDVGVAGGSIRRFVDSSIHGGSSLSPRSLKLNFTNIFSIFL